MSIYDIEKKRLSEIQSSFHKLLNNLNKPENLDHLNKPKIIEKILDINSTCDVLLSELISLNDLFPIIDSENKKDTSTEIRIKELENDTKAIQDLIPILLMYRFMLTP
jgi:hypothetical protein